MGSKLQLYKGFIFSLVFIKFQDIQSNHLQGYAITHDKITGHTNCQIMIAKVTLRPHVLQIPQSQFLQEGEKHQFTLVFRVLCSLMCNRKAQFNGLKQLSKEHFSFDEVHGQGTDGCIATHKGTQNPAFSHPSTFSPVVTSASDLELKWLQQSQVQRLDNTILSSGFCQESGTFHQKYPRTVPECNVE